jgi:hypothetical protein
LPAGNQQVKKLTSFLQKNSTKAVILIHQLKTNHMKKLFLFAISATLFTGVALAHGDGKKCAKGKECAKDGKEMKCDMKGKEMKDCCKKDAAKKPAPATKKA